MNYNNMQPPYYQQPYQAPQPENKPVGLGVASMVLGIISLLLVCCLSFVTLGISALPAPLLSLIGFILGIAGAGKNRGGRGMAITGIVCNTIVLVTTIVLVIVALALGGTAYYTEFLNSLFVFINLL